MCAADLRACLQLGAAFAAVYLIWGSTYLGIRFAIQTLPPFAMGGVRVVVAGVLLYAWTRLRGAPAPTPLHWREAAIVGGLMLLGGNGAVVWAEQRVPSGLTALLVATTPLWMVVLEALRGRLPTRWVVAGVGLGLAGIALLVVPGRLAGGLHVDPLGAGVLVMGSLCWAAGSLYSRRARLPKAALQGVALEMLAGGAGLLLLATAGGEWSRLHLEAVSSTSWLAFAYLIVFGSMIGFSSYLWLLRHTTPARASTYAFVNPVVAVFLGWALAGEPLSARTGLAAAVIVLAVALITTRSAAH